MVVVEKFCIREEEIELSKFRSTLSVYLSGPITHVEPSWRADIAEDLEKIGRENSISVQVYIPEESENESDKYIINRDLEAIEKSDLIISYVFSETFGTPMEIFYSYHVLRKTTFVVCTFRKVSPWLTGNSTRLFKTIKGFFAFWDRYLKENYGGAD